MNILYCGDRNIEDGLTISVLSLLKNVKEELKIYVLTMDFKNEAKEYKGVPEFIINALDEKVKEKNVQNFVTKIDITDLFKKELPIKNIKTRFTPYCMLRLFTDEINEMPNKILYLDTDVICRKDFSEFYNQDISNYEIVGVLDHYGKWFFRNNLLKKDYINSGVLLLNIEKIRETKLFKKCREKCSNDEMFMPDQSAINKLSKYKKIVSRKYNEQRKIQKDTVFQHFTTSFRFWPWFHSVTIKPWQIDKVHKELKITEYDDIFAEYQNFIKNMNKTMEEV